MASRTVNITVYAPNGNELAFYEDVEVLSASATQAIRFKFDEDTEDESMVTRTITTTLPYFIEEEFEHEGIIAV